MGNLYQPVGLLQEAEVAYQQAIARSAQANSAKAQLTAQIGLAQAQPAIADISTEGDRLEQQMSEIAYLWSTLGAG